MKKDRFVAIYGPEYHNSFLFFKVRFLGGESMEDVYIRSSTWLKLMMLYGMPDMVRMQV